MSILHQRSFPTGLLNQPFTAGCNPLTLRWRHNGSDGVSNHQHHHCLLSRLFRRRSKKISKLRVTGLCAGEFTGDRRIPRTNLMTSSWQLSRRWISVAAESCHVVSSQGTPPVDIWVYINHACDWSTQWINLSSTLSLRPSAKIIKLRMIGIRLVLRSSMAWLSIEYFFQLLITSLSIWRKSCTWLCFVYLVLDCHLLMNSCYKYNHIF